MSIDVLVQSLSNIAIDKKSSRVTFYTPRDTSFTDAVVVILVKNSIQCRALVQEVDKGLSAYIDTYGEGLSPRQSGGYDTGWVILDAGIVVVHVISEQVCEYYDVHTLFSERSIQSEDLLNTIQE